MEQQKLSPEISQDLARSICKQTGMHLGNVVCRRSNPECAHEFPVIYGCPVLINDASSVFAVEDYQLHDLTTIGRHPPDFCFFGRKSNQILLDLKLIQNSRGMR